MGPPSLTETSLCGAYLYIWRTSLVDTLLVVRTANLHAYCPLARFPPTVDRCDTNRRNQQYLLTYQGVTSCIIPSTGLYMRDKWLACRQSYAVRPTNPDDVDDLWEHDHNKQANVWRSVFEYTCLSDKPFVRTVSLVIDDQQDATLWFINLFPISSTCFGRCVRPPSGAHDCAYSFWYSSPMLLPQVSWTRWNEVPSRPCHLPAAT